MIRPIFVNQIGIISSPATRFSRENLTGNRGLCYLGEFWVNPAHFFADVGNSKLKQQNSWEFWGSTSITDTMFFQLGLLYLTDSRLRTVTSGTSSSIGGKTIGGKASCSATANWFSEEEASQKGERPWVDCEFHYHGGWDESFQFLVASCWLVSNGLVY